MEEPGQIRMGILQILRVLKHSCPFQVVEAAIFSAKFTAFKAIQSYMLLNAGATFLFLAFFEKEEKLYYKEIVKGNTVHYFV